MISRIPRVSLMLIAAIGTAAAGVTYAQSDVYAQSDYAPPAEQLLKEPFILDVGLFVLGTTTKTSLNAQGVNNPEIDLNRTFGAGTDTKRFRLDGLWRITPRQHVEFMYFTNSISRTRDIGEDQPINWGDYQFSGNVTAKNKISVYELGYEYAFVRTQTFELAASFGIHYTKTSIDISGQATLIGPAGEMMPTFASKE